MRSLVLTLSLVLVPLAAGAQPSPTTSPAPVPTFAGIRWGASAIEVQVGAAAAGLTLVERDAEGDYAFTGSLFGRPAVVYLFMSPTQGFVKAQVRLSSDDAPTQTYAGVVARLTEQYGPTEQVEFFRPPYATGDGRTAEAVLEGKGLLVSAWGDERQPGQAALVVRVTRTTVGLDYESHGWIAECARRKDEPVATGSDIAASRPGEPHVAGVAQAGP